MKKQRAVCITLAMILMLPMFSCRKSQGDQEADQQEEAGNIAVSETEPEETIPETSYWETIEQRDLEGYSFRVVAWNYDERPHFAEEMTGDVVNDAIVARDQALKNRLNIEIVPIPYSDRGQLQNDVSKTIASADDAYDMIVTAFSEGINTMTVQHNLLDLTTVPYVTLDSMYWNKPIADNMRFSGKQFFTSGVAVPGYFYGATHIVFNMNLADKLQLPDLHQMAVEGKWTIDNMASLMNGVAQDLNGDGVMTAEDDQFAAILGHTLGNEMYTAAGLHALTCDNDGNWTFHLGEESTVNFVQKCAALFSDTTQMLNFPGTGVPEYNIFKEGRILFMDSTIANTNSRVRGMEDNYGILPIPVLNEGDPYITECNTWLTSGIAIPVTAQNPDDLGLVFETMAAYSYDYLTPAFLEKMLGKVSTTNADYQILKTIFETCTFELNTIMDFGGSSILMRGACFGVPENYVSSYASIEKVAKKQLEQFITSINTP